MARRVLSIGDAAPWFVCRSTNNPTFHFDTAAGRYLVLSLFASMAIEKNAAVIRYAETALRKRFDDINVSFFGVSIDSEDERLTRVRQSEPGVRFFWDFSGEVSKLYGAIDRDKPVSPGQVEYTSFTLVLDPLLRVIAIIPMDNAERHNQALATVIARLPPLESYAGVPVHAPVLTLPNIFEPQFCRRLIGIYEAQGGADSGFMREKDGNTVGVMDYGFKRRRDFRFDEADEWAELRKAVCDRLNRKLVPEILKAFQFKATRIERFLVACYEGETGGFFRAHRDNTTKGTAHRTFAVTINLNAEEYDGGDLRFPEFGTGIYRAPTGGAVVFSCSLLHEALPVEKGTRYAFLPFLYNEEGARIRRDNVGFLTGEVIDNNAPAPPGT